MVNGTEIEIILLGFWENFFWVRPVPPQTRIFRKTFFRFWMTLKRYSTQNLMLIRNMIVLDLRFMCRKHALIALVLSSTVDSVQSDEKRGSHAFGHCTYVCRIEIHRTIVSPASSNSIGFRSSNGREKCLARRIRVLRVVKPLTHRWVGRAVNLDRRNWMSIDEDKASITDTNKHAHTNWFVFGRPSLPTME